MLQNPHLHLTVCMYVAPFFQAQRMPNLILKEKQATCSKLIVSNLEERLEQAIAAPLIWKQLLGAPRNMESHLARADTRTGVNE